MGDTESAGNGWNAEVETLLVGWSRRVSAVESGHYKMADRLGRANIRLGVPIVVLSSLIGTSVFATLGQQVDTTVRILVGMTSVLMAVLAGLQTFLRFAERAEKHRTAASLYSALRRELEELRSLPRGNRGPAEQRLSSIRLSMDNLGKESPEIGEWAWQIVKTEFGISGSTAMSVGGVEGQEHLETG